MTATSPIIEFELPDQLACPLPTEKRNINRDDVRLLVTDKGGQQIHHSQFNQLGNFLQTGDVLVVNTSATIPSAIPLLLPGSQKGILHLSNQLANGKWLIEIRTFENMKTKRWKEGHPGMYFDLPENGHMHLEKRFYGHDRLLDLWEVELSLPYKLNDYLSKNGQAIRYIHQEEPYPIRYYQTYFSNEPGSAEMPSAARGFTAELVRDLKKKGIQFAPILLHTGVSSLEIDEKPYPEYMEISLSSANKINEAKRNGNRIIAVGTTAIRALESAVDDSGILRAFKGYTELYIEHNSNIKIADALLTGFHEPRASHLHMLQALVSAQHLAAAYKEAIEKGYYWHEFGDLHLILQ